MSRRGITRARWVAHVNGVSPPRDLRGWLTDTVSLTLKLSASGNQFRVRRLRQAVRPCLGDEHHAIGLPKPGKVQEREVVLHCDGLPVVYAHTVVPLGATASDWPFFATLGERSLGTTLFGDPRVTRGELRYARLHDAHPLARRTGAALGDMVDGPLFARRCLYRRGQGVLLVTEVFLPAIRELRAGKQHQANQGNR
ncbi:chorismate--pyruvate lyase family protein [Noviherbaspirillum galbum]|uniref:Probable chorismate pyruvate-lyase n=1 Tax=Noviherbaspirillum galbum TaxID=2709383 RepID=A0A6B3SZR3_9BURK|nr:chorismate lyase [Noviherbaspirillum galbum]NEX64449.1 chorismate lyase [Noviherbaspirillum galbum]